VPIPQWLTAGSQVVKEHQEFKAMTFFRRFAIDDSQAAADAIPFPTDGNGSIMNFILNKKGS